MQAARSFKDNLRCRGQIKLISASGWKPLPGVNVANTKPHLDRISDFVRRARLNTEQFTEAGVGNGKGEHNLKELGALLCTYLNTQMVEYGGPHGDPKD
ncbi:hypothetical protein WG66_006018 [Moniliophthora roreri]|nr:hypothetical protein WG66_006018 [Moniliophthora roreri]